MASNPRARERMLPIARTQKLNSLTERHCWRKAFLKCAIAVRPRIFYTQPMRVLILQHEKSTSPGSTIQWCQERGHRVQILAADGTEVWPTADQFDFLVICGGSMNVDQEAEFPWLKAEKSFLQRSLQQKKKIVGLCLGGQLLAEALGGRVQKQAHWEVGWQPVQLDDGTELVAFQWHGYQFSHPPKTKITASNEACPFQAFSFGNQALGFQFHPETTEAWAIECAEDKQLPTTGFTQTGEEIKAGLAYQPKLQAWYFSQLDRLAAEDLK